MERLQVASPGVGLLSEMRGGLQTGGMVLRNPITARLRRRVEADFPPADQQPVLALLGALELPLDRGQVEERILAALVLLGSGDRERFDHQVSLARRDWRDVLVAAGLARGDWPERLRVALGPE